MRTEYILSDWQKERVAMIRNQIDMLQTELASIYATAKIRVITESEEEEGYVRRTFQHFGQPLIREGVVKIVPYDKEERGDRSC